MPGRVAGDEICPACGDLINRRASRVVGLEVHRISQLPRVVKGDVGGIKVFRQGSPDWATRIARDLRETNQQIVQFTEGDGKTGRTSGRPNGGGPLGAMGQRHKFAEQTSSM
jgi:hypothetical protein